MNSKEENSLVPITSKNSATVEDGVGLKTSALHPLMEIFRRTPHFQLDPGQYLLLYAPYQPPW
jgi:hypothetical protein